MQLYQHLAGIAHDVIVALARQLGDLDGWRSPLTRS
jgi:hypothetical protein